MILDRTATTKMKAMAIILVVISHVSFVLFGDVTPKSWTVYLICFDVVSCIVQDSCRA